MPKKDMDKNKLWEKETKRRKIRIWRDVLGLLIMAVFVIIIFVREDRWTIRTLLMVGAIAYTIFIGTSLRKSLKQFYSLSDHLVIRGEEIIKWNSQIKEDVWAMPLDKVVTVYTTIGNMPNTIYVVFKGEDGLGAESFYKRNVKKKRKVYHKLKERGLLKKEPISFEKLREMVEGK